MVVMADADLDRTADIVAKGAFGLSGQACTGTSRLVVHESIQLSLLDRVMERAQAQVVGNGLEDGVTMGPLANQAQWDKYTGFLEGGRWPRRRLGTPTARKTQPSGGYLPARRSSPASARASGWPQEVFRPVLAFLRCATFDEAVQIANDTPFGLSAGIVTSDIGTALAFSRVRRRSGEGQPAHQRHGDERPVRWHQGLSSTQTSKEQAGDR